MTDATRYETMDKFIGINNVDDPVRLGPSLMGREYVFPLLQANNVLIDNSLQIHSRPGFDTVLSGTDIHSLWSEGSICLYVDMDKLTKLGTEYITSVLRSGLTIKARMSYAAWNDKIYYTNYFEIGYIQDDVSNLLVDPNREFKVPLPAGQLIEHYKACLFVARDNILYISDPLCDYYDKRTGYRVFADRITLLRAVDSGIYVGDSKAYWIKGDGNDEFERIQAHDGRPVIYTDIRMTGSEVGQEGEDGNIAMWTCESGICLGDNSGNIKNITEEKYTFTSPGRGAAFIRDKGNVKHYINSLF